MLDADRLDLARVGIESEISRLCTPYARKPKIVAEASKMALGQRRLKYDLLIERLR